MISRTKIEALEERRLKLQSCIDTQKSQDERNELGQFATPPKLAREIVSTALGYLPSGSPVRFLEPGFGTGAFFSSLLQVLGREPAVAKGIEVDPLYGEPAKELWRDTEAQVCIGDFTQMPPPRKDSERFNFLVCNPPYSRHHHLSSEEKLRLRHALRSTSSGELSGLAGLHCYFMLLAHDWMAEGGIAAWLIPSEFMEVNYASRLRDYLVDRVSLLRLHLFDPADLQFGDALVSSAVLFLRKSAPPAAHHVRFTLGGSLIQPSLSREIATTVLCELPRWPRPPFCLEEQPDSGYTLADFFAIKRGIATGDNNFFILTREQIEEHKLPPRFLAPILPSPRYLEGVEILADEAGAPQVATQQLFLLDCPLPEEQVRKHYPHLWKYLEDGRRRGVTQRYLCRHRWPWYSQERRPPAPFLCTYMGRARSGNGKPFRLLLNRSRATAPNVYLLLYPAGILAAALHSDASLLDRVWRELKNVPTASVLEQARTYGGGLHKLEPSELGRVSADGIAKLLRLGPKSRGRKQLNLFATN